MKCLLALGIEFSLDWRDSLSLLLSRARNLMCHLDSVPNACAFLPKP